MASTPPVALAAGRGLRRGSLRPGRFWRWERIGIARGVSGANDKAADNNFTLNGSRAVSDVDIKVRPFMAICLAENDRRFAGYDCVFGGPPRRRRRTADPLVRPPPAP